MTLRCPAVGSLLALIAGASLAVLALASCSGGGGESSIAHRPTRTPSSPTAAQTPGTRAPVTTGTPAASPSGLTPPAATPSVAPPPTDTPEETTPPGPEPTLPPAGTPPSTLPDLVILDMFVSNDRVGLRLANRGKSALPAGHQVEFGLRSVTAETVKLGQTLLPGTSVTIVLESQMIYRPETVLAVVDPSNVIPEEDDDNNALPKRLAPDVTLDLAVHDVLRAADGPRLQVVIQNLTDAPVGQVEVVVTVYLGSASDPTDESTHQLNIEPQGFETVEVVGVAALAGARLRVVAEMTNLTDADPANNVWQGIIS